MIEVYVYTNEKLELRVYNAGVRSTATDVTVSVYDNDSAEALVEDADAVTELEGTDEVYTYILPLEITNSCRVLRVEWTYTVGVETITQPQYVEVVVPYTTPDELIRHFPEFAQGGTNEKSFDELKEMERAVRHVIDTYCKQSFGKEIGLSRIVLGKDANVLMLPRRLYELDSVSLSEVDLTDYVVKDQENNWVLGVSLDYDDAIARDVAELLTPRFFRENRRYLVTGNWGWEYVPNEVNLAARMLVSSRYCRDEAYRQKYMESVRSADFRIQYWKPGNLSTGLVDADMILARYRLINMVVV